MNKVYKKITPFIVGCIGLLCSAFLNLVQAQTTISGIVVDELGEGLPGVNILEKGTTTGTVTDFEGKFSFSVSENATIIVSFVGFTSQEIVIGSQTSFNIQMEVEMTALQELVVVGYGSIQKSDLTGAVSTVDVEAVKRIPSVDVSRNLQGTVAGVQVTTNSGAPGQGTNIRIRGTGSFANANPLFVVDGLLTDDISNVNPADIESIEVLKDASASAIYGSRGSNGVIIITTKGGFNQKTFVEFNTFVGVQTAWRRLEMMDPKQFAELYVEAHSGPGNEWDIGSIETPDLREWIREALSGEAEGTDWQKEVFRTAPIQNYNLTLGGGSKKLNYKVFGSYFNQQGIVKNTYGKNYQAQADLRYAPVERFSIAGNLKYSVNDNINYDQGPYSSVLATAIRKDPINPIKEPTTGYWDRTGLVDIANPARLTEEQQFETNITNRIQPSLSASFEIVKGLKISSSVLYDQRESNYENVTPPNTTVLSKVLDEDGNPTVSPNESFTDRVTYKSRYDFNSLQNTNLLSYDWSNDKNNVNAVLGLENYQQESRQTSFQTSENSGTTEEFDPRERRYTLLSYFARVVYSFDDRYLFTGTVRRDGSSKFPEQDRWGTFPSFSLGWNIDRESFFPQEGFVSEFKLRGSWGQIGNQGAIAPYSFRSTLSPGWLYAFNNSEGSEGFASTQLAATEITWETSEMMNIGLDLSTLDNRLSFIVDFFIKDTKDLLVDAQYMPTPIFSGANAPSSNAASMRNRGWEFTVDFKQKYSNWSFGVGANISFVNNKVTALGAGERIEGGNYEPKIGMPVTRTVVGESFGSFYGLRTDGIFQTDDEVDAHRAYNSQGQPIDASGNVVQEFSDEHKILQPRAKPGDVRFINNNGDGVIDADDAEFLGSPIPDFTYGFYFNVTYKQWYANIMFAGQQGNEIANVFSFYYRGTSPGENNLINSRLDRWVGPGSTNTEPRVTIDQTQNDLFSDRYVEDGSYLRMRNIQIGWNFPRAFLNKFKLSEGSIYIASNNLLTFSSYSGFDPEVGLPYNDPFGAGVDIGSYPLPRTTTIGLNLKF